METYQPLHYIFKPGGPAAAKTLLLLHGTGGNESDLLPLGAALGAYHLLGVRGNVSENGMPRFFRRLGMGIFDEDDLEFRTHELHAFLKQVSEKEKIDSSGIIAVGYSNGANIAASLLALYPEFLCAAVLYRPMQPFRDKQRQKATTKATPVLIADGMADPTVMPAAQDAFTRLLVEAGFNVTAEKLSAGHQLTAGDVKLTRHWLEQHSL